MDEFRPEVPFDGVRAAADALRELGYVPGEDPVAELRQVASDLLAASVDVLSAVAARSADAVFDERAALARLDLVYRQCLTALAPLVRSAAPVEADAAVQVHPGVIELCLPPAGARSGVSAQPGSAGPPAGGSGSGLTRRAGGRALSVVPGRQAKGSA